MGRGEGKKNLKMKEHNIVTVMCQDPVMFSHA